MFDPAASPRRLFWTLQIGSWSVLVPAFTGMCLLIRMPFEQALFFGVVRQVFGFVLTLGLATVYLRWPCESFSPRRHGAQALGLSLGAAVLDMLATIGLAEAVHGYWSQVVPRDLQFGVSVGRAGLYVGWSALFLALRQFIHLRERELRRSRAETEARNAELRALRAQLNPHFLFNSLNSILAEADDNPAGVRKITFGLSELLRFSLRQRSHFGPLGEEIAAIENYLRVERSRFEERLDWSIELSEEAAAALAPTSLILPLVENAIKYGLQTSPALLRLRIEAEVSGRMLTAVVANTGHWLEPDSSRAGSNGIGLANLRRRLALLCGPSATVDISQPAGWVRVALRVPTAGGPA